MIWNAWSLISTYKKLFVDYSNYDQYNITGIFPTIDISMLSYLGVVVSPQEIYRAIKYMGSFKAIGLDNFQIVFYQSQWCYPSGLNELKREGELSL